MKPFTFLQHRLKVSLLLVLGVVLSFILQLIPNPAYTQCVAYFCGLGKDQTGINFDHGMVAYLRGRGMTVTPIQVDANANLINAETSAPITFSPSNYTLVAFSQSAGNDINPSSGGGSTLLSTLSTMSVPLWTNDYHLAQQLGYTLTTNSAGTPQKTMFIVDNTSPILPTGFPNQANIQVFSDAIVGAYINYMREDYGLPAGSTLGAFINGYGGPPQLGSLVTYLYVPASGSSGTKVFLGYSLNGFAAAQFNPATDLTTDGLSLLNKSFDVLSAGACAATCTAPTAPNAPVVAQATCNAAGNAANNDASITIAGITNGLSYAYTTDGSAPTFASAVALTGGTISLTNLANPAAATTYTFRIFNGSADCFVDVTATLNPKTCTPTGPCVTVVPTCPTTLVIDNFNTPQPQIFVNRPNGILSAYSNISTTDAICGQRDSYIVSDTGDNAGNLLLVGAGAFYNDEGPGGTASIYFTYDGSNNATNEIPDATVGLGGINLSGRQFKITSVVHDMNLADLTRYCDVYVKVWSSPTQMSQAVVRVDGNVPYNVATTLTFPALVGSADLTSVRAIQLFFDTHGNAVDVSFDDFVSTCNTCVVPTAPNTPVVAQATCNAAGNAANNDATITIAGITNGLSYAYTTDGSAPTFASAIALTGGTISLTNLANPATATTYKFRIFNGTADCFVDVTATLNPKTCTPNCVSPNVATPVATQATCNAAGTAANNDASVSISTVSSATSYAYTTDGTTPTFASAVALSGTSISLTNLANPATATTYKFRIFNGTADCFVDVSATLNPKICTPNCVLPNVATPVATQATCNAAGTAANNDASISISTVSSATSYAYTTDGTTPTFASAIALSGTSISLTNLANPAAVTTYKFRIFNGTADCFVDVSATLNPRTCTPTCVLPNVATPVATQATCNAAGTAANNDASVSISAVNSATSYAYTTDGSTPAFASAVALSGTSISLTNLANPTTATTYKFRIFNGSADCFVDVSATLNPRTCTPTCVLPNVATPVATQATCNAAGTAANNDASVSISAVSSATSYAYTTDGTTPAFASAIALAGTSISLTNLANPAAATTYKFRIFNGTADCFTDISVVLAPTICSPNCTPPTPLGVGKTTCEGNATTLAVTGCNATHPAKWYSNSALTSAVGTGDLFSTPALTTTTTYYVVCEKDANCKSTAATVIATILPKPAPIKIGTGESYTLTTEAGATSIQWYKDGVAIAGQTTNTLIVTGAGSYTYSGFKPNSDLCRDTLCCPIVFVPVGSLGDFVWKDANNNGIQDETSPNAGGVAGVQIELYKNGTFFSKDTTDAQGNYLFTNLDAGTYKIKILSSTLPAGCTISSIKDAPNDDSKDSDVDKATGESGNYLIDPTDPIQKDILTVDAALATLCVKPNAGPDAASVCQPVTTAKLTAVTTGGTWSPIASPTNPAAAIIDNNGNITGMTVAGIYKFVYSVTGGGITCTDTAQVEVKAKPIIADATSTICAGESVDLTAKITGYATLLSPVWTVATAAGTPVNTPIAVKPTTSTTYVLVAQNAVGCKDTANVVVTVNPKPNAGADKSLSCANAATNTLTTSTTLTPVTAGGTFTQIGTTPAVASISGNNVTGMSVAGTYQFQYSVAGCLDTVAVTVQPCTGCVKPNAGPDAASVCQPITTAKLTAVTTGGTWTPISSPANPAAATIDNNGNINGLTTAGIYKFVYSVTGGGTTCTDTAQVEVKPKPVIADGAATICAGETLDLTSKITGYATLLSPVWTLTSAAGTPVSTPTAVKPSAAITYVLVAQNAAGCKDTANVVVTVNPKPNAGADKSLPCANAATNTLTTSTTLTPVTAGGTWTQIGTTPAVTSISGNNVTGMSVAGTYQFQYSVTGCLDTVAVTVQPCAGCVKPNAGPDQTLLCSAGVAPSTTTLVASPTGGTWTPLNGNPVTASVTNTGTVTGMTTPGVYKFIYSVTAGGQTCQDTVAIIVPNCNCNPAVPTLVASSITACAQDTFPTLKATVVGLATVEWFTQLTGGSPVFTGLNYKPSGMVPTTGAIFYAQARSTDPTCPAAISSTRVIATINAQDCTKEVDLTLKKAISTKIAQIGDVLSYTIKVWNQSNTNATGVEVTDSIATTAQFQVGSFATSRGTTSISGNVIKWNIGNIAANGDTVTLTYQVKAMQEGVHFNTAEISKVNEKDKDSTPNNGKDEEDDIDHQCFTVPFKLCAGSKVEASIHPKYTNVQWFKDGATTPIASGNVVLLSRVGVYTYTAANQTCPVGGCCPIIIENSSNCCPVEACIPFTIRKIKK